MQIIRQLSPDVLNRPARTILTIGAYDGIHRGHKQIISGLKEAARAADALSALITFYPRPKVALGHSHANADYLTTLEEKLFIFESLGLEVVAVLPFTSELAQTSPRAFIRRIVDALHPLAFWVGPDFKFGQDRQGDIPALRELGLEFGFSVRVIDQQMAQGEIISSTRIRLALLGGQIREVTRLLGDYPFWLGEVVHGAKRGRKIGFPTANVAVGRDKILPANGVYAVWFHLAEQVYPAVANIGTRPTFNGDDRTIEVHIFDFDQDIYGQAVRLELVDFLRPERKFSDFNELVAQIGLDAGQARAILAAEKNALTEHNLPPGLTLF